QCHHPGAGRPQSRLERSETYSGGSEGKSRGGSPGAPQGPGRIGGGSEGFAAAVDRRTGGGACGPGGPPIINSAYRIVGFFWSAAFQRRFLLPECAPKESGDESPHSKTVYDSTEISCRESRFG